MVATKPTASRWAQAALGDRWIGLIEETTRWRKGLEFEGLEGMFDFIYFTLELSDM